MKYKVNHDAAEIPMRDGSRFKLEPGQHLTSIRAIAKGVGWYEGRVWKEPNPKTIDTIIRWLEKSEMIRVDRDKGNKGYTLISLINWAFYQTETVSSNNKVTIEKQSVDINNNNKEFNTTTTTDAEPNSSPIDPFTGQPKPAYIVLQDTFCEMHQKIDINLTQKERLLMKQMVDGDKIPVQLIIRVMKDVYGERTAEGTVITSFLYYKNPVYDVWRKEQALTDFVPTEAVALGASQTDPVPFGTVAPGSTRKSQRQKLDELYRLEQEELRNDSTRDD
ncbi:hypothetical protein [Gordoniibacillus kamchatkensis]|uniref:hypothetical protein n=1 Tax=Gordoniibacillus kamchatkensis TaxID=1590651 RepID=UPI0012E013AA|nr:hypothetical protein [Paenibacillus sp. VKM B-2647]